MTFCDADLYCLPLRSNVWGVCHQVNRLVKAGPAYLIRHFAELFPPCGPVDAVNRQERLITLCFQWLSWGKYVFFFLAYIAEHDLYSHLGLFFHHLLSGAKRSEREVHKDCPHLKKTCHLSRSLMSISVFDCICHRFWLYLCLGRREGTRRSHEVCSMSL